MTVAEPEHFRDILMERGGKLEEWLARFAGTRGEEARRVRQLVADIKDALFRVENGSFGECTVCHGEVETRRLEVKPIRQVCLDCITADEHSELEQELNMASQIHRALLPQRVADIPGIAVAVRSLAARVVGGDYYDFLPAPSPGWMRIIIGDIMGKGLPAGLMMSNLQGALRIMAEEIEPPGTLVTRLNRWLCRNIPVTKFVSLACVSVGPYQNGVIPICYANAGHRPPILVRERRGHDSYMLPAQSSAYLRTSRTRKAESPSHREVRCCCIPTVPRRPRIPLVISSKICVYSSSRRNRDEKPDRLLDRLVAEVTSFAGRADFADDLTAIALRCTGST